MEFPVLGSSECVSQLKSSDFESEELGSLFQGAKPKVIVTIITKSLARPSPSQAITAAALSSDRPLSLNSDSDIHNQFGEIFWDESGMENIDLFTAGFLLIRSCVERFNFLQIIIALSVSG